MAKLKPGFMFTGTLGNMSAYTRRGSDQIILRAKGGPSKHKVKTSPKFVNTRRNNAEFGGRATASRYVIDSIGHLKPLAGFGISGPINKLLLPIQKLDTVSDWGQRNVCVSKDRSLLAGFDLNRENNFSSLVRSALQYSLDRDAAQAIINIPALLKDINFFVPGNYPLFSIVATFGLLPDLYYGPYGYKPGFADGYRGSYVREDTAWLPISNGAPATTIQLNLIKPKDADDWSMVLGVGIRFATIGEDGQPKQLKHTGAAKILALC